MEDAKSGSNILTSDPYLHWVNAQYNSLSSGTDGKSKTQKKKKTKARRKTHMNINALVGPQTDTWTKFFVLNVKTAEKSKESILSNMKILVGLRKLLQNN